MSRTPHSIYVITREKRKLEKRKICIGKSLFIFLHFAFLLVISAIISREKEKKAVIKHKVNVDFDIKASTEWGNKVAPADERKLGSFFLAVFMFFDSD
jgi:hypothetical protein